MLKFGMSSSGDVSLISQYLNQYGLSLLCILSKSLHHCKCKLGHLSSVAETFIRFCISSVFTLQFQQIYFAKNDCFILAMKAAAGVSARMAKRIPYILVLLPLIGISMPFESFCKVFTKSLKKIFNP